MIIRFNIQNYRSFGKSVEFNMLKGSNQTNLMSHVKKVGRGLSVVNRAVVYGNNGAGKSNLVKAIDAFQDLVVNNTWTNFSSKNQFRLNQEIASLPTKFEMEFIYKEKMYFYSISLDLKLKVILEETLEVANTPSGNPTFKEIFKRQSNTSEKPLTINKATKERLSFYVERLKPNETLLHFLKEEKTDLFGVFPVYEFIKSISIIKPDEPLMGLIAAISINEKEMMEKFNRILSSLDTGVNELCFETEPLETYLASNIIPKSFQEQILKGKEKFYTENEKSNRVFGFDEKVIIPDYEKDVMHELVTKHKNDIRFDIGENSDGTIRLIELLSIIALMNEKENGVVIVDEIERSIHPLQALNLLKIIDDYFLSCQMIMTTHESLFLDQSLFRLDEFLFCEKDEDGQTSFFPLSDFKLNGKTLRNDLDIRKGYLQDRFGAVPFFKKQPLL